MLKRRAEQRITRFLDQFPAVILVGARQVGKSTLARKLAGSRASVVFDLENELVCEKLLSDPVGQLCKHDGKLIVLDEVQKAPNIFEAIRVTIDQLNPEVPGRFLLLGSASGRLLGQSGESLFGRAAAVEMFGLDCLEVGADADSMARLWDRGGFPRSYLAEDDRQSLDERWEMRQSLLRDNLEATGFRIAPASLGRLLLGLARGQGGVANAQDLARRLDASPPTIARHMQLLEEMMLVRKLPAFARVGGQNLVKKPKYYIRDSGILHALHNVSIHEQGSRTSIRGPSWEGFVLENLLAVLPPQWEASFYRNRQGHETDLVLQKPGGVLWTVEIKAEQDAGSIRLTPGNRKAMEHLQPERSFVVHGGSGRALLPGDIEILSLAAMMNELMAQQPATSARRRRSSPAPGTSSQLAALAAAMKTAQPDVFVRRDEFIASCTDRITDILAHNPDPDDVAAAGSFSQLRNEVVEWLQLACRLDEAAAPGCSPSILKSVKKLLETLLSRKLAPDISGPNKGGKAGTAFVDLAVCDFFVHVGAILLAAEKFAAVNELLADGYVAAGALHDYRQFYYQGPQGDPKSVAGLETRSVAEAADALYRLLQTSAVDLSELLTVEQIIFLFGVNASIGEDDETNPEWETIRPQILGCVPESRLQPLEFFLRLPTRQGRINFETCIKKEGSFYPDRFREFAISRMRALLGDSHLFSGWQRLVALK